MYNSPVIISSHLHTWASSKVSRHTDRLLLQVLLEPLQGLDKGIFFRVFGDRIAQFGSDGESMLDSRVQVDLVWQAGLLEDDLTLVTLFGGEDGIGLCSRDGKRTLDALELICVDEGWVGGVSDIYLASLGPEVAHDVLSTKAVTYTADFLCDGNIVSAQSSIWCAFPLLFDEQSLAAGVWIYLCIVFRPQLDKACVDDRVYRGG